MRPGCHQLPNDRLPEPGVVPNAWYNDGNHRVAVAFLLETVHIAFEIIADDTLLSSVLPRANRLPDLPPSAPPDLTPAEHAWAAKKAYYMSLVRGGGHEPPYDPELERIRPLELRTSLLAQPMPACHVVSKA